MNVIALFVLGLLIGWLAEWVIDWYYWRARLHRVAGENARLQERITSLEAEKGQPLESAKGVPLTDRQGRDNFQAITGIGPAFSKRLHAAGIETFAQLSQLTSRQLEEILGDLYKRFFSKQEKILAQAKEFARQKAQKS
jgi:predicted flap endonuclease-1-like 5' DNA nuclease